MISVEHRGVEPLTSTLRMSRANELLRAHPTTVKVSTRFSITLEVNPSKFSVLCRCKIIRLMIFINRTEYIMKIWILKEEFQHALLSAMLVSLIS